MKARGIKAASKVLVIKRDGVRPFVEAEPAFSAIRQAHPRATVDLVTGPELQRLAKASPYFDRVVATRSDLQPAERKAFAGQLRRVGYHVAYDLDGTKDSLELRGLLKGFRGPQWVGPKRSFSTPKRAFAPSPLAGPAMRKLLAESGLPLDERLPDLGWVAQPQNGSANLDPSWFGISGAFALFAPAANPAHRWPAEHYAEVAAHMAAEGVTPVIIGGQELGAFAFDVLQQAASLAPSGSRPAVDLTGKADAAQMAVLSSHARFFVGGACDELHLILASGAPGIVLVPTAEDISGDALFGRKVVKLTAANLKSLTPELALMTLRNMGLIRGLSASQGRAFG